MGEDVDRSPFWARAVAGSLAFTTGFVHLALVAGHWTESRISGLLFAAASALLLVSGAAIVLRPSPRWYRLTLILAVGLIPSTP